MDSNDGRVADATGLSQAGPKVSALSGFDPSRLALWLILRCGAALTIAALMTITLLAIFAMMEGAAWFAFGAEKPSTPWWLYRFILFIGWCLSVPIGFTYSDSDGSPKGEDADAASSETTARAESIAQPPSGDPQ